ncbi:hypothetical protein ACJJTC_015849 [Scirpophaga incertulas]
MNLLIEKAMVNKLCLLLLLAFGAVTAYRYPDLPPGPYCGLNHTEGTQCCANRHDECSRRIRDTLCYCDEFCSREDHDDCCPDYEEVCMGMAPPEPIGEACVYKRQNFFPPDTTMQDCNSCQCSQVAQGVTQWVCEHDLCLMDEDLVHAVNNQKLSWRAAKYSQFYGKKLKDALVYKLGTFPLSAEARRTWPMTYNKENFIPQMEFDSRKAWPGFISPVVDQGWCGSDWAVSIAGVMSDRYAIQSNGAEKKVLSPQSLLSCSRRMQRGCKGGHIDVAWNYAKNHGLVDEECYPYEASVQPCKLKRHGNLIDDGCQQPITKRTSRYKVGPIGRLQNEEDIMYDIMQSGPVHAIMTVYQDFFHYRTGVYERSKQGNNQLKGLHSVRIVGWGEEQLKKYWLVANSWGEWWGEAGYFKIRRGVNEADIESFVVTVLSDVTESLRRK